MTEAKARLDKSGYRIICGRAVCGADIGTVVLVWPRRGPTYRMACFPPAWYQGSDGIWRLSARAKRAIVAESREKSIGIGRARSSRPNAYKRPIGRRPTGRGLESGQLVHALKRPAMPAQAQCWQCRLLQILTLESLRSIDPRTPLPVCEVGGPETWEDWEIERIPEDTAVGAEWRQLDLREELTEP